MLESELVEGAVKLYVSEGFHRASKTRRGIWVGPCPMSNVSTPVKDDFLC